MGVVGDVAGAEAHLSDPGGHQEHRIAVTDTLDRLRAALEDRYAIEREVGSGGMATVYLAEDLPHDRQVAIKVLRPDLAAALGSERFHREIKIAARLRHPHILPLYDSGGADGLLYYVMPFVSGDSLRDRLVREKQLSIDDALNIAREVAEALDYAHGQGVIHRDIKPENILLSSGHAEVVDFWIARACGGRSSAEHLTQAGIAMGTPAYMSPEQASTSHELDGRSDVYALGCVLYEMLAGQPPFVGPTVESVVQQHLTAPAPRVTLIRSSVPLSVERLLQKALEKTPADRYPSAAMFAKAIGQTRTGPWEVSGPWPAEPAKQSIAVLPFTNMSADPENEYFSDGITEEIISMLSKVKEFRVAARSSSFAFKGQSPNISEVAARLNVATVLEGSVRKVGNRLRITAQLVSASDGYHMWSERYDRELKDVFAIQDELAQAIVRTLKGQLTADADSRSATQYTDNVVAYELYLKGRYVQNTRTRDGITRGIEYFGQAIQEADDYAPAYAGLADSHYYHAFYRDCPPREAFPKASAAAARAIDIDEKVAEAHTSLGAVRFYYDWDWKGAEAAFRRAIELNPNHATCHHWYAEYLAAMNRLEEALASASRAHDLDPLSLTVNAGLGWVQYFSRRYDEAIQRFQKTLELDPHYLFIDWFLGQALLVQGRTDEAVSAFRRGLDRSGGHPGMAAYLAHACAKAGREPEAVRLLSQLEDRAGTSYVPSDYLGVVCLGLGETDRAFEWFDRACDERALHLVFLGIDPLFDELRSDPRFARLLRTIGLEQT